MSKALLVVGIIAYLFIASFLCASTYEGVETWNPGFVISPERTYIQNFTSGGNITDYNIIVTKGSWNIEENYLISKNIPAEFFIDIEDLKTPEMEYNVSNIDNDGLLAFYAMYSTNLLDITKEKIYWLMNPEDGVITCWYNRESFLGLNDETKVLCTKPYTFSTQHIFIINYNKTSGIFPTDYVTELYIDDEKIDSVQTEIFLNPDYCAGVYTTQSNLKIASISETETREIQDIEILFVYTAIIGKILTFQAPDVMPWYMIFLAFYLPIVAVLWMGAEMLRGN